MKTFLIYYAILSIKIIQEFLKNFSVTNQKLCELKLSLVNKFRWIIFQYTKFVKIIFKHNSYSSLDSFSVSHIVQRFGHFE